MHPWGQENQSTTKEKMTKHIDLTRIETNPCLSLINNKSDLALFWTQATAPLG